MGSDAPETPETNCNVNCCIRTPFRTLTAFSRRILLLKGGLNRVSPNLNLRQRMLRRFLSFLLLLLLLSLSVYSYILYLPLPSPLSSSPPSQQILFSTVSNECTQMAEAADIYNRRNINNHVLTNIDRIMSIEDRVEYYTKVTHFDEQR